MDISRHYRQWKKRHLAISAAGYVLLPMVFFKGKHPLKFHHVAVSSECKWVDEVMMLDWVCLCYQAFTQRQPSMLVMDSFRAHLTDKVKKETRKATATQAIVPGGCTSVLQPLDVSVNKPFKSTVRGKWIQYMREEAQKVRDGSITKISPPSKQLIVDWVAAGVRSLREKTELVRKSFVVMGINASLNGSDDHLIRSEEVDAIFAEEDDEEFEGFTAEDIAAPTDSLNSLLMEWFIYDMMMWCMMYDVWCMMYDVMMYDVMM